MSNNNLIKSIEAIQNADQSNIDQRIVTNFLFELKVSNLLIPTMDDDEELVYETFVLEDEELILLPLFTSVEEFYKYYDEDGEFEPMENEFEIYAAIVEEDEIDGIVIDPEGVSARVPKDMVEFASADFSIDFDDIRTRSKKEIKRAYNTASNRSLIRFINDEANADNLEGIMVELSNSDVFNLIVSDEPLDGYAKNGVIEAKKVGGFNLFAIDGGDAFYGAIFTDKDAMLNAIPEDDDFYYYGQLTSIGALFDFILRNDMDGVLINPGTVDYLIPRSEILSQASGVDLVVEDKSFRNCLEYAFIL